jgi:hypothetical protein
LKKQNCNITLEFTKTFNNEKYIYII